MQPQAHCMPIYLYGSLSHFADVRAARNVTPASAPSEAPSGTEPAPLPWRWFVPPKPAAAGGGGEGGA